MIQAENVRRQRIVVEPLQLVRLDADVAEILPHPLLAIELAGQEIESQPAAFVLEVRLIRERPRTVSLREIFRLNQTRARIYFANLAHREHGRATLGQHRFCKQQWVAFVRIPVTVETTETRGRERFVDGRVVLDPRKTFCDRSGKPRQLFRKFGIEKICVRRTAAVMQQSDYRLDVEAAKIVETFVGPAPVKFVEAVGGSALPQNGIAQGLDAQRCEAIEIADA